MTIVCKVCKEILVGPDVAPTVIDPDARRVLEFAAMYSGMASHIRQQHAIMMPLFETFIDQYAFMLATRVFDAVGDEQHARYEAFQKSAMSASWLTLASDFSLITGSHQPSLIKP